MNNNSEKTAATASVLVKSGFWYTISGFLSKALVFLTTPIFTRLLTKEQYGNFTVFASWQSILIVVCGLEVYATINKARFDYTEENELNAYITSSLLLSTIFTAVFLGLYLIFPNVFHKVFLMDSKYMMMMFMYLFTYPAYGMFQAKQRIDYKYKLNAVIAVLLAVVSSVLSVVFAIVISEDRLWGRVIGQYVLYILAGLIFYIGFIKNSFKIHISYFRYAIKLAVPLVFSYLGSAILLSSDSLVVKHICTGEQVGYLSITHNCVNIVLILVQMLNSAWCPWFYDKLNVKEYRTIRKKFSAYVWIVVLGTFVVLIFAPEIIKILGGKQYMEAIHIIPVSVMSGVFSVLTNQFVNLEVFHKKQGYAAIISSIAAGVNVFLDFVCVKLWGYKSVCYVTLLCQGLMVLAHYKITIKMNIREILPKTDLIMFSVVALALIPISMLLYQSDMVRVSFIAIVAMIVGIMAVIKRKEIIRYISQFKKKQ